MGLSASSARTMLLTSKSNALGLQAQFIEQERLVLSQQQEDISQEYTDATSNQIYVTSSEENDYNGKTLTMQSMAEASPGGYIIANSAGEALYMVVSKPIEDSEEPAEGGKDKKSSGYHVATTYYKWSGNGWVKMSDDEAKTDRGLKAFNSPHINNRFQTGLKSGAYQLFKVDPDGGGDDTGTNYDLNKTGPYSSFKNPVARSISLESGDFATSKYYTEDDAAAQAAYQTAMVRINILDTRLENKLNALEKDKKAVDTELESAKELVKKKTEGFKYFS